MHEEIPSTLLDSTPPIIPEATAIPPTDLSTSKPLASTPQTSSCFFFFFFTSHFQILTLKQWLRLQTHFFFITRIMECELIYNIFFFSSKYLILRLLFLHINCDQFVASCSFISVWACILKEALSLICPLVLGLKFNHKTMSTSIKKTLDSYEQYDYQSP